MRTRLLVLMAVAALFVAAPAFAGVPITPTPILVGPEAVFDVGASDTHLGWDQNSLAAPRKYNAFASDDGGATRFRLNEPGTRGYFGDIAGTDPTTEAIYQQIQGNTSDLYWYDLGAKTRSAAAEVNSNQWEWSPHHSDGFILFLRDYGNTRRTRLLLYDRDLLTTTTLADVAWSGPDVYADEVGDQYATYTVCNRVACNAWYYDIAGATKHRIDTVPNKDQYGALIDEGNGVVYWVRSGHACGASVRFLSAPIGSLTSPTVVATLPAGVDVVSGVLQYESDNTIDLVFTRWRCGPGQGDIFELPDVDTWT